MANPSCAVTENEILSHAIDTIGQGDWIKVARVISKMRLPERDLDRVDQLLERNRDGALTEAERAELDSFLRVGNFIDLMKARALQEIGGKSGD